MHLLTHWHSPRRTAAVGATPALLAAVVSAAVILAAVILAAVIFAGCASTKAPAPAERDEPAAVQAEAAPAQGAQGAVHPGFDDRISRSRGQEGGVVVLWPRVIPASDAPIVHEAAHILQDRMVAAAKKVYPGRPIDVRPSPERVCPQAGCLGLSVGAVLMHHESKGCAAVLLTGQPGRSDSTLTPWMGELTLRSTSAPFRGDPPESFVRVKDFASCRQLVNGEAIVSDHGIEQAMAKERVGSEGGAE